MGQHEQPGKQRTPLGEPHEVAFSNAVRLTGREWLFVGLFTVSLAALAPSLWRQTEELEVKPDDRMPHELSNDYWLYERFAEQAAERYDTMVLGDSVVWGEFTTRQGTLSHYLNEHKGQERYANLGLAACHPLALAGLVEHYARSVTGKRVLLHCNPLWLTSPRADQRDEKATDFNHPRLVPQFLPRIPSYKAEMSERIGIVVEQHLPLSRWTTHLQQAYYDRTDIPSWTMEHPYDNPARPLTRGLAPVDDTLLYLPQPWYKRGIGKQDYPWVDLETSLQWQAFQRVVTILRERDNRLFVLVGPFNEHLMTAESLKRYHEVKATIAAWLGDQQVPHAVPPPLPSELYGDASHPLAGGYALLARQLRDEPFFQSPPAPAKVER
jgi:hypothetical protein